jgi:hypothetical protein
VRVVRALRARRRAAVTDAVLPRDATVCRYVDRRRDPARSRRAVDRPRANVACTSDHDRRNA